ncbi:MAG: hypothetical protein M1546_14380 [Chloroflexi bacterium]|nr:hypothetical protein [Chloroflexota bacterium]
MSFNKVHTIIVVILLGAWLAAVIFTTTRHEYLRDEVRAWSLARAANSLMDLFELTRNEGHPVLWYLLLYVGKSIADTPLVLPITSIIVAFAAVAVFMFLSPFPPWIKGLFIFSALPLYEYSVMARNYGISMLLLFIAASLYRNKQKHWLPLSFVLALLANTNVHSAIFVCLIMVLWVWDAVTARKAAPGQVLGWSFFIPLAVSATGIVLCALGTIPPQNNILTDVYSVTANDLAFALFGAIFRPDLSFSAMVPPVAGTVLLYFAVFGLLHRPNLLLPALGGQIALGVFFYVGYIGSYRHEGLFLSFILFLYWIALASWGTGTVTKQKPPLFNIGLYGALFGLILVNIPKTSIALLDIRMDMSSSKAFGAFLNESEVYRDAIIVPEPDYLIESLPYYAHNTIYLPREHRFGTTVSWTTEANGVLSLGELVSAAHDIKVRYGRPVLIVLGHTGVDKHANGWIKFSYNKTFKWSLDEREEADRLMMPVSEFLSAMSDEKYRVYALK